jgi:hypothetical protein
MNAMSVEETTVPVSIVPENPMDRQLMINVMCVEEMVQLVWIARESPMDLLDMTIVMFVMVMDHRVTFLPHLPLQYP